DHSASEAAPSSSQADEASGARQAGSEYEFCNEQPAGNEEQTARQSCSACHDNQRIDGQPAAAGFNLRGPADPARAAHSAVIAASCIMREHSASRRAFTPVFDGLGMRVNALVTRASIFF